MTKKIFDNLSYLKIIIPQLYRFYSNKFITKNKNKDFAKFRFVKN